MLGAHDEHRQSHVVHGQRAASDAETTLREIIVEEQSPQILDVHSGRQARAVGVPGHQVERYLVLAEQVVPDRVGPDEVVGTQHLERAAHLRATQISLCLHDVVEKIELVLGDEQLQLTGLGKVGLGGEQRQTGEAVVVVACHRGSSDGQQRAAKAVAGGMDLRITADRLHRVDRRHHTLRAVIIERRVAHLRAGITPGDREHGAPLRHQPADQRIAGREVEDIVFHDPGGHDQHRLRADRRGRRRVLDQLDQGEVAPNREATSDRTTMRRCLVAQQVTHPGYEASSAGVAGSLDYLRVEPGDVGRRHQIEPLPHGEGNDTLIVRVDSARTAYDAVPPFLAEQHRLSEQVVGALLPSRMSESAVTRQRCDCFASSHRGVRKALPLRHRRARQRCCLERRVHCVDGPIRERETESAGRSPGCEAALRGVQQAIEIGFRTQFRRRPRLRWPNIRGRYRRQGRLRLVQHDEMSLRLSCVRKAETRDGPHSQPSISCTSCPSNCWASRATLRSVGRPVLFRSVLIRHALIALHNSTKKDPGQCLLAGVLGRTLEGGYCTTHALRTLNISAWGV